MGNLIQRISAFIPGDIVRVTSYKGEVEIFLEIGTVLKVAHVIEDSERVYGEFYPLRVVTGTNGIPYDGHWVSFCDLELMND